MPNPDKRNHTESPNRTSRLMRSRPSPSIAVALTALFVALNGTAIAAQAASKSAGGASTPPQVSKQQLKKKNGKRGPAGPQGPQGPPGPSTGPAGGALAGTYPSPVLSVTGGDSGVTACRNGEAMAGLSVLAAITCSPGVYSDASANVAAGPTTFPSLTTGFLNTAQGSQALAFNTSGSENTAFGESALTSTTIGNRNTAVGQYALAFNTTGEENTAIGEDVSKFNTTGSNNSSLGWHALDANTTGSNNVGVGHFAGGNLTTGSNNIDISNAGVAGESATTRIGTEGTQTGAFVAGVSGVTTGGTASPVLVDSNGQLGTTSSSRRFKKDIAPLGGGGLSPLMRLKPVSFRYRSGHSGLQFGLIAEQVAKLYPSLVVDDAHGRPSAVAYQELPALLLAQVQRQQRENKTLRAQNRHQQHEIDWLMRRVRGH